MMKQDFLVIEISHICPTRSEQNDRRSQKQHALNQWSSAEGKVFYKQHALKGQKLLAQGTALGIKAFSNAPCKGKSFKTSGNNKDFALTGRHVCEHNNPGRCPGLRASALSGRAAFMSKAFVLTP